jgi:alpha/beta superfamily hydrolase
MRYLKFYFFILFFNNLNTYVIAQLPYALNQYAYDSLINVSYGQDIDYAGNPVDLVLDIYKPKLDSNCLRPIVVLVHGGAWFAGSKEDVYMKLMSREFAKKGWVVANINYRLGTHKAASYNMYALCNNSISAPWGYISDSAEIFRANYRGMQDAKGAIRFMKNRNAIDSSDVNNVFIVGESAGAFIAYATAFTDQSSEKSSLCNAISNAPIPDNNLTIYGCIPANNDLARPDLGSIDGNLNLGNFNASVKGIGSFYGAAFDLSIINQLADTPCVYMFHQGADVVVNYQFGRVLGRTSWECYAQTNLCQSYFFYPHAYGNESLKQYYSSLGAAAPVYQADIVYNYYYLNNCFSNGHSIDNFNLRVQNMTNLFANKIALSANNPSTNCTLSQLSLTGKEQKNILVYPNPASNQINLKVSANRVGSNYSIFDYTGKLVLSDKIFSENSIIDVDNLNDGIYLICLGVDNACTYFSLLSK